MVPPLPAASRPLNKYGPEVVRFHIVLKTAEIDLELSSSFLYSLRLISSAGVSYAMLIPSLHKVRRVEGRSISPANDNADVARHAGQKWIITGQ